MVAESLRLEEKESGLLRKYMYPSGCLAPTTFIEICLIVLFVEEAGLAGQTLHLIARGRGRICSYTHIHTYAHTHNIHAYISLHTTCMHIPYSGYNSQV